MKYKIVNGIHGKRRVAKLITKGDGPEGVCRQINAESYNDSIRDEWIKEMDALGYKRMIKRYFWKKSYGIDEKKHWALSDTESEQEGMVVSGLLVLVHCDQLYNKQKIENVPIMKRIVDLLNRDERNQGMP